jgi:hypothetical protein
MMATAEAVKPAQEARTFVRPRDRKRGMRRVRLWMALPVLAMGAAWGATRVAP